MRHWAGVLLVAVIGSSPLWADEVTSSSQTVPVTTSTAPAASVSASSPAAVAPSTASVEATSLPGVMPSPPDPAMNQMTGSILSVDEDAGTFRLQVEGGFNVGFTYDAKTKVTDGGKPVGISDLDYGDQVVVRYVGMDLKAWRIERLKKGPRDSNSL